MRKILVAIAFLFVVGCVERPPVVIYRAHLPKVNCFVPLEIKFEQQSIEKTPEENFLVAINNIATMTRAIENLVNSVRCYEEYLEMIEELNRENAE